MNACSKLCPPGARALLGIADHFGRQFSIVNRYNKKFNGHMQFLPHIKVEKDQSEAALKEHIQRQADLGAVALYVWGVAADKLVQGGDIKQLGKAVELAKNTGLPIGVGGHSLLVPKTCEQHGIPCDFYVKTFHSDEYPSATPKPQRKEFIWLDGGPGWYDNMWCINPEETISFMKTVAKPWIAFKVLAAGSIYPRQAFPYAFSNGADFIAVGMFDFQIKDILGPGLEHRIDAVLFGQPHRVQNLLFRHVGAKEAAHILQIAAMHVTRDKVAAHHDAANPGFADLPIRHLARRTWGFGWGGGR